MLSVLARWRHAKEVDLQYRSANDSGDCEETFGTACNDALRLGSAQSGYMVSGTDEHLAT